MRNSDDLVAAMRRSRAARIAGQARRKQFPFVTPPPKVRQTKGRGSK